MAPGRRTSKSCLALLGLLFVIATPTLADETPAESAAKMSAPAGFNVTAVVGEPLIRQPVAIEFDERGRLWVMQYLQYPNPAGLKRVKVDRYSRTAYDRVPAPPPFGPRGEDRLTIVRPGRGNEPASVVTDFVSGLNLASGFTLGYNSLGHSGVFILQAPYLLFYADKDRDDKPDSDPEVLLSGFGMEDAHSVANSLTIGPDGWLYGCQGSTVTANIRGIEFQQGVWRYHPPTKRFELFCEGGGNSWGLDFDAHGQLLYSTNFGGHVLLHGKQGGYYWKSFGKHGALHNPFAFGYFDHATHENFTGGHVTVGGIVYRADHFPPEFRGKYIGGDTLGHALHFHEIEARRSTFVTRHAGTLVSTSDAWFAPTDVCLGPDGCVYFTDWRDVRTAHPDPDATWDKTNGRVYRLSYGEPPATDKSDLAAKSTAELIDLLDDRNAWRVRTARRLLVVGGDEKAPAILQERLFASQDEQRALESLWALYSCAGLSAIDAPRLLAHESEHVRAWVVRLIGDEVQPSAELGEQLACLAADDPSRVVRSQLACTAKRLPASLALPILRELCRQDDDIRDPHLPLLIWWAFERHALPAREAIVELCTSDDLSSSPLIAEAVVPRLLMRYLAEGDERGETDCLKLLGAWVEAQEGYASGLWRNVEDGVKLRTTGGRPLSPLLAERIVAARKASPHDLVLVRLSAAAGDWKSVLSLLAVGEASDVEAKVRAQSLDSLADAVALFEKCGGGEWPRHEVSARLAAIAVVEPEAVQLAAIGAFRRLGDDSDLSSLVGVYPTAAPAVRSALRTAILGKPEWAPALLEAAARGDVKPEEFTSAELAIVAEHHAPALDELVRRIWGKVQGAAPEEKLAEVRRLNNDLRAAAGELSRGRELFVKHCGACHRLGDVGAAANKLVGPDLTHANRKDRDFLLVSLVDPSNSVRKEFVSHTVQTTDGRVLSGIIARQTPAEIVLVDAKAQETRLATSDIEELQESPRSLMPDDLYKQLSPSGLRDLFAFLQEMPASN